jgi:DNA helicase-2/ATP-dependent DNA helicase PcrA
LTNMASYLSVGELIEEILNRSGYKAELVADTSLEGPARLENVNELIGMANEFEMPTGDEAEGLSQLDAFLSTAALLSDADSVETGADKVTMMSLHSAKGLEYPIVFLVGMEEGIFPHRRALEDDAQMEEERRLCYVGMTRARKRLYVTSALSRTIWNQTNYNSPSRFLDEVPPDQIELVGGRRAGVSNRVGWGENQRQVVAQEEDASPAIGSSGWGKSQDARRLQREAGWGAPSQESAPQVPELSEGDRVHHTKFGEGLVRDVRGDTVTVHFPGLGQKVLVASYLVKIEE